MDTDKQSENKLSNSSDLLLKAILIWFLVPIGGIILFLIKDENKLVMRNAKLSIYYLVANILVGIIFFGISFVGSFLSIFCFPIGLILFPLTLVVIVGPIALQIYMVVKMAKGEEVKIAFLEKYL